MLDPWAVRHARWKKIPALFFYERNCLKRAACLHAMSAAECDSVRSFGLRNPVCVIPNGVDIPTEEAVQRAGARAFPEDRRVLLYIGRLHEKKNLSSLLDAWALLKKSGKIGDWILAIAGWDQDQQEMQLRRRALSLGLEETVRFLGPQFGDQRIACYRDCDGVILPSLSEGLPMVILEAWAFGKPVIMTPQCNLPEGFAFQAAMRVEPITASISDGIADFLGLSDAERRGMGGRGLALVRERFVWKEVAGCLLDVYTWLAGGGPPPACIDFAT
jgi:poly(glycerol-phosphate) alpha-glucosyltransferase